jgi:hypothetical protein
MNANDRPVTLAGMADLRPFGIDALTGEACGLGYRILCDVTEAGRQVVGKMLGVPNLQLAMPWNSGSKTDPHVGSLMVSPEFVVPLAVFCLLENGCKVVLLARDNTVHGFKDEAGETEARVVQVLHGGIQRAFRYGGTAGDRNVHQFTGRVE